MSIVASLRERDYTEMNGINARTRGDDGDVADEDFESRGKLITEQQFSSTSSQPPAAVEADDMHATSSSAVNLCHDNYQIDCVPDNHHSNTALVGDASLPSPTSPDADHHPPPQQQQLQPTKFVARLYRRRWLMVLLFAAYSMSNAYQWIHLNIIGDKVLVYYNASLPDSQYMQEVALDWLSMIYMLAYIPLILPLTWLLDRRGLRLVAIIGSFLNALGAWLKCAAVHPDRFALVVFAQTICAVAQVFVLGLPTLLAAVWFGPNEVSTATAFGVFGNQIGCALGFLIPPEIVVNTDDLDVIGHRLSVMFYGGAAVTSTLFILIIVFFQGRPPTPPSQAQMLSANASCGRDYVSSLRNLFFNSSFLLLLITYGINTGSYYAIGTLLNPIVLFYFKDDHLNAGRIGLTLVLSGVAGSILSGIWLDKTKYFKLTTVVIYTLSCAGMLCFTLTLGLNRIWLVFLCSGILGFFMTGYLPVGFEFSAEITYPEPEGTSSGLLNASAQVFGILLTLGIRALTLKLSNGMLAGNLAITSVLLLGVVGTILIRSDLRRQNAQQTRLNEALIDHEIVSDSKMVMTNEVAGGGGAGGDGDRGTSSNSIVCQLTNHGTSCPQGTESSCRT